MTFKERLQKEHPSNVDSTYEGGCWGCPKNYGYESHTPDFCDGSYKHCTKCWNREIKEEDKMFTKNMLKDNMIIELRNGNRFILIDGCGIGKSIYSSLKYYGNDLTSDLTFDLDIMKVFEVKTPITFMKILDNPGKLIWERKDVKKITAEEAARLLKEKFPEYESVKIIV